MEYMILDLQLFAEGTGAAAAAPGAGNGPVAGDAGASGQKTEDQAAADQEGAAKTYTEEDVQRMIRDRVKNLNSKLKAAEDREKAFRPALDKLGRKYKTSDDNALAAAIMDDKSIYDDEAMERGVTTEQIEAEAARDRAEARLREIEEENYVRNTVADWRRQAEELKATYPNIDLDAETENPEFMAVLRAKGSVKTAYETAHLDELMRHAMNYAQKDGEKKTAQSVAANAKRPVESATVPASAGNPTFNPRKMTKAQRDELAARAARGERISF